MSGFSASITQTVNSDLAKGRGPVGKGSRKTSYNHLLRNNYDEVISHIRLLRATRRMADRRSRVDDPHQMKWFLEESRLAMASNLERFRFFSSLLQRKTGKQPSQSVVAEFIVFIMGCPQHHREFGSDILSDKKPDYIAPKDSEDEDSWESGFCGAPTALNPEEWGIDSGTPDFADEEDNAMGGGAGW
jgi:hypothetical protein